MIEIFEQFHFLRPQWLLLLLPSLVVGALLWRQRRNEAGWSRVVAPQLLNHLISEESLRGARNAVPALIAAWCLVSVAAAGPSWRQLPEPVLQKQDALVIIMDLSYSMLATDLQPSRQDRVRRKMLDLLRDRREGLTALIAYAGDAHIVAPLTDDNPTIANLLPALSPQMMPLPGSNPVDAVEQALNLLDSAGVNGGRLLLVTDGISTEDVEEISGLLAGQARRLALLGIGTEVGAPIALPDGGFLKDQNGEIVVPALDEAPLRELASQVTGGYRRLSVDDGDLQALLDPDDFPLGDDDTIALDRQADQWEDMAHWFVLPLLLACLVSFRRGWVYVLPLMLGIFPAEKSMALEWQDLWKNKDQQGAEALRGGDASAASALFEDPRWRGTAAYQDQDYEQAQSAFGADESADGWYNRGNALAGAGRLDEAIDAYRKSLEMQPDAADAQKNLETVERLKEQQEQNQQQQQGEQNQNGDQQEQQDQEGQQNQDSESQDQQSTQNPSEDQQPKDQSEQENQNPENEQENQADNPEQGSQGDQDQAEEASERPAPSPSIDNSAMQEDMERDQAMQQWLRRVPDDPSGLLREKFRYESRQRQQQGKRRETTKIW